jgi:nitric oxide dioxygenase
LLSSDVIQVIKLTVPALVAHGETLTRHFYRRMFTGDPAVKAFFNPAHQHTGGQQRALAAAICAYAENIERPEVLAGAVELIAQKHASLGIQPEHYPIVGKHLLGSIREVLGEAATDTVINAWAAAYGLLADILIKREAEIYAEHREAHGWHGFEPFVVTRKVHESAVITSFYLAPASGGSIRLFKPGQYITVRVPTLDGGTTMRNYSLSGRAGTGEYRISVKRETGLRADAPDGFVSNHLHARVNKGDTIELGPPCGEFTLQDDDSSRPLVLISGGVGITPVLAMLHAACARNDGREILFLHAAVNGATHAFRREVLDLGEQNPNLRVHFRYSNPTAGDREQELADSEGFIDAALLRSLLESRDAAFYFCGPRPFMLGVHRALTSLGIDASDLHYEFFGPKQELTPEPEAVA